MSHMYIYRIIWTNTLHSIISLDMSRNNLTSVWIYCTRNNRYVIFLDSGTTEGSPLSCSNMEPIALLNPNNGLSSSSERIKLVLL